MAKLIVTSPEHHSAEFPIDRECITIGRKDVNDIKIDALAVSGHHAHIITLLNESFIEDLNSTNGTFVNSKLIQKHALKHGDVVVIGKHEIQYVNELAPDPGTIERTTAFAADAMDKPSQGDGAVARLQFLNGNNAGKELTLSKPMTTLGKPGTSVAAITRRQSDFYIVNIEAASQESRARVNGELIGSQAHQLFDHDVIDVAGTRMEFILP